MRGQETSVGVGKSNLHRYRIEYSQIQVQTLHENLNLQSSHEEGIVCMKIPVGWIDHA